MSVKCKLVPYKEQQILSAQELREKIGWGIKKFDIHKIWNYSNGEDTIVSVVDTGVDLDHDDLKNNLLPGINIIDKNLPPQDDCNHGTHVAGIIAAEEGNNLGIAGVSPKTKIIPVKVLDEYGDGDIEDVIEGILWSVDQNIDAMCISLGTISPDEDLHNAIKFATEKNILVFVAAGNLGESKQLMYPANYPETIAIGAIDKALNRADFSMTGDHLDFVAPGVKILSTVPDNWYSVMSGSSQATPFVVGLSMLMLSYIKKHKIELKLESADDYRSILKNHTIDINDNKISGDKFYQGFGIISPQKFLDALG